MLMEGGLPVEIIDFTDDDPDIIEVFDLTDDQNQDTGLEVQYFYVSRINNGVSNAAVKRSIKTHPRIHQSEEICCI